METVGFDASEMVRDPTPATAGLIARVAGIEARYEGLLRSANPFAKYGFIAKLMIYARSDYREFYRFVKDYGLVGLNGIEESKHLAFLLGEFERLFDKALFNNTALAYSFLKRPAAVSMPVMTKEDEKIESLQRLCRGEMPEEAFKKLFGHYALNAYELAERRFDEYGKEELLSLSRLALKVPVKPKASLEQALASSSGDATSVLIALRELAKDRILLIVREIRRELMRIGAGRGYKDIFQHSLQDFLAAH